MALPFRSPWHADAPRESLFCGKIRQKEKETMTEKNEIRQDKVTKQWVIYAPLRGKRPRSEPQGDPEEIGEPMEVSSYDKDCPFCPGNERMLSTILLEIPPGTGTWRTRVVSNKYPALSPQGDTRRFNTGIYLAMAGYGRHEVVIEIFNMKYATGTMKSVKKVEAERPKIKAHASPEKTGSRVMGQAPRAVVAAVSTMGRNLTAPL
jgi:hypothetical protein